MGDNKNTRALIRIKAKIETLEASAYAIELEAKHAFDRDQEYEDILRCEFTKISRRLKKHAEKLKNNYKNILK